MKYALVTGACINTGVAIVEKFLSENWNVVFTGRSLEKVEAAERAYKEKYPEATVFGYAIDSLIDARTVNEDAVKNLFEDLDKKGIFIDTMVLNAADQGLGIEVFENPLTDFMKVINTNMTWNYCLTEYAAKRMIPQGSASKGGQLGMMRALALDLGKYNIRVNAVLPGMIKTDRWEKNPEFYNNVPSRFTPLHDVAVGEDVADAVWYFAAHARNTTGAELVVDGGNTIQLYPIIE